MPDHSDSPFDFPCRFPIKIFGRGTDDFQHLVVSLIARHVPETLDIDVSVRESRAGRYQAVSVTIEAESRAQLDAIYRDLSGHERVLMVL